MDKSNKCQIDRRRTERMRDSAGERERVRKTEREGERKRERERRRTTRKRSLRKMCMVKTKGLNFYHF